MKNLNIKRGKFSTYFFINCEVLFFQLIAGKKILSQKLITIITQQPEK